MWRLGHKGRSQAADREARRREPGAHRASDSRDSAPRRAACEELLFGGRQSGPGSAVPTGGPEMQKSEPAPPFPTPKWPQGPSLPFRATPRSAQVDSWLSAQCWRLDRSRQAACQASVLPLFFLPGPLGSSWNPQYHPPVFRALPAGTSEPSLACGNVTCVCPPPQPSPQPRLAGRETCGPAGKQLPGPRDRARI